jgi:hypothetical protein
MNGFTEHLSGASERRGTVERLLTWGESRAMLPLVGRVARDVIRHRERLAQLFPERDRLERNRHTLDWPQRQRRYQIQEEIITAEKELCAVEAELDLLGVIVLEASTGLVGFPTMVNNRPAFFSWMPEEETLTYWNFADDTARRPIPEDWTKTPREVPTRGRAKNRK